MLKNDNAASFWTQFWSLGPGCALCKQENIVYIIVLFYCNNFDYLGALLKQEVILNKTILFWGNALAIR